MISTGDTDCKDCGRNLFARIEKIVFGTLYRWRCIYCGSHREL